jgi:glycosyltransferase involved in cell wall biosynthesis
MPVGSENSGVINRSARLMSMNSTHAGLASFEERARYTTLIEREMKKRVLMLLANGFDPDPRVHREACSLVNFGYEVTILAWDRQGKLPRVEIVDGIYVERIPVLSTYGRGTTQLPLLLYFWMRLIRIGMKGCWDLIHCHDFDTLPPGWLIGKLRRLPVVFDAHESYHEMLAPNVSSTIKKAIASAERLFVRRVDMLITVGSILEAEYQRRGARATCVVGNWKPIDEFQVPEAQTACGRKKLNIPQDSLIVSYIGFLEQDRGLFELIEAVQEDLSVHLILGGKGTLESTIKSKTSGHDNITFLGFVSPHLIPLYTAIADVVYYCLHGDFGNNKYSAPNKLFEALAGGRAIITGNVGEIARIVQEEKCGICLPEISPASLLGAFQTLRNQALLADYKHNALLAGRRVYNWSNAEQTLWEAYVTVLQPTMSGASA